MSQYKFTFTTIAGFIVVNSP